MTGMSINDFYKLCDESFTEKEKKEIKVIQDVLKKDPMIKAYINNLPRLYINEQLEPTLAAIFEN